MRCEAQHARQHTRQGRSPTYRAHASSSTRCASMRRHHALGWLLAAVLLFSIHSYREPVAHSASQKTSPFVKSATYTPTYSTNTRLSRASSRSTCRVSSAVNVFHRLCGSQCTNASIVEKQSDALVLCAATSIKPRCAATWSSISVPSSTTSKPTSRSRSYSRIGQPTEAESAKRQATSRRQQPRVS